VSAQGQTHDPFADVPSDHPAYDAVNELAKRALILGCANATFHADRLMAPHEVAAAVARPFLHLLTRDRATTNWPRMPILPREALTQGQFTAVSAASRHGVREGGMTSLAAEYTRKATKSSVTQPEVFSGAPGPRRPAIDTRAGAAQRVTCRRVWRMGAGKLSRSAGAP
jgi:hypothetical protein